MWPFKENFQVRYCKDCLHVRLHKDNPEEYSRCKRPMAVPANLVTGKVIVNELFCDLERGSSSGKACGKKAKYWEPKS